MNIGFSFINPIDNWLSDYWNIYIKNNALLIPFLSLNTSKFEIRPNTTHLVIINSISGGSLLPIQDFTTLSDFITKIKTQLYQMIIY